MAGYAGVTLFFVLSGFVLVYTYGPVEHARIPARRFLIARVARLYPMYLAALVIALSEFIRRMHPGVRGVELIGPFAAVLTSVTAPLMIQAWIPRVACAWNCPGWSLSAETFFYLAFPLLAPVLRGRSARVLVAALLGASVLALAATLLRAAPPEFWGNRHALEAFFESPFTPLHRLPEFLVGIVLGRWYLDRRLQGVPLRPVVGLSLATAAAVAVVVIAGALEPARDDPKLTIWLLPAFSVMILGLAERGNRGVLARPIALLLGEASYALYLIHGPMHAYALSVAKRISATSLDAHPWIIFAAYLGTVLVLAVLFNRYLEHPARLALRRRFARPEDLS